MAEEVVRSENTSLEGLSQALKALGDSADINEQAEILVLINELFADASCRCEEKSASYGEDAEETVACAARVSEIRGATLEAYKAFLQRLAQK